MCKWRWPDCVVSMLVELPVAATSAKICIFRSRGGAAGNVVALSGSDGGTAIAAVLLFAAVPPAIAPGIETTASIAATAAGALAMVATIAGLSPLPSNTLIRRPPIAFPAAGAKLAHARAKAGKHLLAAHAAMVAGVCTLVGDNVHRQRLCDPHLARVAVVAPRAHESPGATVGGA
jgi:hypothetical protein